MPVYHAIISAGATVFLPIHIYKGKQFYNNAIGNEMKLIKISQILPYDIKSKSVVVVVTPSILDYGHKK